MISNNYTAALDAIATVWPGAKIDRQDTTRVWRSALEDMTSDQLQHGIKLVARSVDKYAPNPGQFRAMCTSFRAPRPKRAAEVPDESPKTLAWRQTQQQFAAKLNGAGYEFWPRVPTDFPISIVIADVPYDEEKRKAAIAEGFNANRPFDERLFERLKVAFEYRWGQLQRPNSSADQGYGRQG